MSEKTTEIAKIVADKNLIEDVGTKERKTRQKYPHAVKGTMRYEEHGGRVVLTVEIKCRHRGCKAVRRVATSDLFQVCRCHEHTKAHRNAARVEKRAEAA